MQAALAAWLMATLTPSPIMVALVQSASTAPSLLFGFVAGVLADIFDRRRVIVIAEIMLLGVATVLGIATLTGVIGPALLLTLTFLGGLGFVFFMPAQQATVNELVPRSKLAGAVALTAIAFNVSRAIGPAIAGSLAALAGLGYALLACAPLFLPMILATRRCPKPPAAIPGAPETLFSAIRSGIRYARHSQPLRAVIIRNASFTLCASALWALLPVIARDQFGTCGDRRIRVAAIHAQRGAQYRHHHGRAVVGVCQRLDRGNADIRRRPDRRCSGRGGVGCDDEQPVGERADLGACLGARACGGDEFHDHAGRSRAR